MSLGITAIISVAFGWVLAGRHLQPLARITETARHLSERNLHERIALDGTKGELRTLATTFNGMIARLGAVFESQRRFVANASHELQSPLTLIIAKVDVALADPLVTRRELLDTSANVRDAATRCSGLVERFLTLTTANAVVPQ